MSPQPALQPSSFPFRAVSNPTSPQGGSHWRGAFRPSSSGARVAREVGMRETWPGARFGAHFGARPGARSDTSSGTRSGASSDTRSGNRFGLGLLRGALASAAAPTGAGGLADHRPALSSKQPGRLGYPCTPCTPPPQRARPGGCTRRASKLAPQRPRPGRAVGVQAPTLLCTLSHTTLTPWQAPQHANWTLTNFVPPVEPREHEAHVQMLGLEHMKSSCEET